MNHGTYLGLPSYYPTHFVPVGHELFPDDPSRPLIAIFREEGREVGRKLWRGRIGVKVGQMVCYAGSARIVESAVMRRNRYVIDLGEHIRVKVQIPAGMWEYAE